MDEDEMSIFLKNLISYKFNKEEEVLSIIVN